jgi:hypothetical protein
MKIYSSILQRKGTFLGMPAYLKISGQPPAAIFVSPIAIEKLIKAEGLILVKLTKVPIQDPKVVASFSCLSFTTEFVGDSFDVAAGFSVLKNVSRRLRDFPGIFLGPGRVPRLVFAWFWGPGKLGEGRLG